MSASRTTISSLLEKTTHYDKDERYMATSDLCEILKRGLDEQQQQSNSSSGGGGGTFVTTASQEKEICRAVLQLLHDASHDVQAVAVKTLGVLLQTVHTEQVLEIADSLTDQVLDAKKGKLRDVYTIGLRTTVKQTSSTSAVANRLLSPGRLLAGISSGQEEIALACLDVLGDLLAAAQANPQSYPPEHYKDVLDLCLSELTGGSSSTPSSDSAVLRKRAGNALAGLSVLLPDDLLHTLIDELLLPSSSTTTTTTSSSTAAILTGPTATSTLLSHPTNMMLVHARIRTLCAIAGAVSTRLVPTKMSDIIPVFLQYTGEEPDDDVIVGDDDDADPQPHHHHHNRRHGSTSGSAISNELREACFMGLESFVRGPPSPDHQAAILQAALRFLKYDPNYVYDDDDDDEPMDGAAAGESNGEDGDDEMQEDEDTGGGDYDDEDEGDEEEDDDDDSWKVRRSAIRVLKAIIDYERPPTALWEQGVGRSLVQRFKEREENCRVGVLECYTQLLTITLKHCKDSASKSAPSSNNNKDSILLDQLAKDYTNDVVKAAQKILATKLGTNDRSKSKTLALLSILCQVPGGIGPQLPSIMQHVQKLLADQEGTNKALRLDGLSLVVAVVSSDTHDPAVVRTVLKDCLLPQLCLSLQEQWYKNIAEALKALVYVPGYFKDDPDSAAVVSRQMYGPILPLLAAHDVDQEIKECALKAAAALLVVRQLEPDQSGKLLSLLLDRLKNETTRIVAIKTISSIANSDCDLGPILTEAVLTMASFMEYTSRSLKQAALEALAAVVQKHGAAVTNDDGLFAKTVVYVVSLFNDRDLHFCHLSLRVVTAVLEFYQSIGSTAQTQLHSAIIDHALEPSLVMATSSLLRDQALGSLLSFFRQLVDKKVMTFQELFAALDARLGAKTSKGGVYNLSKSMSAVITSAAESEQSKTLDDIFARLGDSETPTKGLELRRVQLAVLMTGDLGRSIELGQKGQAADKLKAIYEGYFASSSEDLRSAVAYALGNASVGSPSAFLPMIVSRLGDDNKRLQFLLLSALREFIQCNAKAGTDMTAQMATLVPPLEEHCSDNEEGVRSLVAECLGSLAVAHPDAVLPKLAELQKSHGIIAVTNGAIDESDDASVKNSNICSTIATSVKHAIAGQVDQSQLAPFMPTFAELIQQEDLRVRNAALLMLYSAFHHMPNVVSQMATKESIMPFLYKVAELKAERKVDLGPFTHTVDDALPLRKSALSIFATCLETNPDVLDIPSLMAVLARSLGDKEDIQLHAHQIIMSMVSHHSYHLSASLNSFVEPLEKTMNKKAGNKTGTELERLNDLIKSSLRVMITLGAMEGANGSTKFMDLVQRVKGNSKFVSQIEAIESES